MCWVALADARKMRHPLTEQPAESQSVRPMAQEQGNRCALGELLSPP